MKSYHVANWQKFYENNRSRKISDLRWVPIPNAHDGEKYTELITNPDGPEIFAAWILILQVASRCAVRGTLMRSNGQPHDSASLSLKTRAPSKIFEKALPYLEKIGWLTSNVCEQQELMIGGQLCDVPSAHERQSSDEEGNGKNGREQKEAVIGRSVFIPPKPEEVESYASSIGYPMNGQAWCDSYAQKGWAVGKGKMKDWKAAVRNWKSNGWLPSRPVQADSSMKLSNDPTHGR